MHLIIHVPDAEPYKLGDEAWQHTLAQAIEAEADIVVSDAGSDILESPEEHHRDQLRERIIREATARLRNPGDEYMDPGGTRWSLRDDPPDPPTGDDLPVPDEYANQVPMPGDRW